jgi:amino acid transporter
MGRLKRILVGSPLHSDLASHERIPKWKALAVLSSDALSSVAYATEEVLIPLAAFSAASMAWSLPIALCIGLLIIVITISYRQTIDAYPSGGGAYTVSKENLGTRAGLVAAAALLIDYVLTVAVSVAAGVENISSAFPALLEHKEIIGVVIILMIMTFNLRGVKESASIFAVPTYLFVVSFVIMILAGLYKIVSGDYTPVHPVISEVYSEIPIFLLLRAFSSGCSALTGIEAISNGIPIFKEPAQTNAKTTMLWMSGILGGMFLGITLLAHQFGIMPSDSETTVSLLAKSIFGTHYFYYFVQATTALILVLAANTSYADFPRLASLLAKDGFLPRQLASLGDRLVFSNGIMGLSLVSILLLVFFKGDTHLLIPLYAVGVFLSFTLSQFGMVKHHLKLKQKGWHLSLAFNFVGGLTTLLVLVVIGGTKFIHGAWLVILLIPVIVLFFRRVKRHYVLTAANLAKFHDYDHFAKVEPARHIAIVPISGIHKGVFDALRYAASISTYVKACTVDLNPEASQVLMDEWKNYFPGFELVLIPSPFRSVITPIIDYVDLVEKSIDHDMVTVVIPEFVTGKWYHSFLHNQTAFILYARLRTKKNIIVTSVRYHI